ncbi:hypothetical protein PG994_010059 [Apiospora phragmitis]|uniref:GH16 domain-containing protein n=1 Tax=Apiospora phragmitis TaxID=2905665 RepID=A0ABR1TNU0_9PEZI
MLRDGCVPNKAWLSSNYYIDFTKETSLPANWIMANYEVVNFNSKGAEFAFNHKGDAPNLWTDFYLLGGRYDVVMKIAPGFGTTPFPSADGKVKREVRAAKDVPQGPMKLQLGVWDGGDPDGSYWTKKWAGGETDLKGAPYVGYVRSVNITNKYPACAYKYNGRSGLRSSVQIIKDGCQTPSSSAASKKPASSSSSAAASVSLPNFQREVGGYPVSPAPSGGTSPAAGSSHPASSSPPASSAAPTSQAASGPSSPASSHPASSAQASSAASSYAASGLPSSKTAGFYAASGIPSSVASSGP